MAEARTYNSPLREKQAHATRIQILDALVDLVSEVGAQDLNIKDLAARAAVSERTVYRHFPDRTALVDGLFDHLDATADWQEPSDLQSADDVRPAIERGYALYDDLERETRALVLMNVDPARTATRSREHIGELERLVGQWFPELDEADVRGVAAVLGVLISSRTWLRLLDGNGMSGRESSRYVGWAVDLIMRELRAGNPIAAVDTVER